MKDMIIMTHTQLDYDSRVQKQIIELSHHYNVIVCCQKGVGMAEKLLPCNVNYTYFQRGISGIWKKKLADYFLEQKTERTIQTKTISTNLSPELLYQYYHKDYTKGYNNLIKLIKERTNLAGVLCNDVMLLPFACRLVDELRKNQNNIFFIGDMHEVHFDYTNRKASFDQMIRTWLCDTYIKKCDLILTVSHWGKELYNERYPDSTIQVVQNCATYHSLKPGKRQSIIRLVHVGMAQSARKIENMILLMNKLGQNYTLDFYLIAITGEEKEYRNYLKNLIDGLKLHNRIRIIEPVSQMNLIQVLNQYDIGIYYLKPIYHNHKYVLPNKLFEYIQARIAIVTTPVKSMKEVIESYQVGIVSKDYTLESFRQAIEEVSEDLMYYKKNTCYAAKCFNFETEFKAVLKYLNE